MTANFIFQLCLIFLKLKIKNNKYNKHASSGAFLFHCEFKAIDCLENLKLVQIVLNSSFLGKFILEDNYFNSGFRTPGSGSQFYFFHLFDLC